MENSKRSSRSKHTCECSRSRWARRHFILLDQHYCWESPEEFANDPHKHRDGQRVGSGVEAAEDTAQGFFADRYESTSPEFQALFIRSTRTLKTDMDNLQEVTAQIQSASIVDKDLDRVLAETERQVRLARNFIRDASVKDKNSLVKDANKLRTINNPTSRFILLLKT